MAQATLVVPIKGAQVFLHHHPYICMLDMPNCVVEAKVLLVLSLFCVHL